jgi:hypothetical protein
MNKADITGRWNIVEWVQQYDDGRVAYPMGKALRGFIEYGQRHVFVVIEKAHRPPFSSGGQWSASDAEKAAAYDGYMTYCGEYEVDGPAIIHRVHHSLFPDWEGGVQKRQASLNGNLLTLSGRIEDGTPQARVVKLIWQRAAEG